MHAQGRGANDCAEGGPFALRLNPLESVRRRSFHDISKLRGNMLIPSKIPIQEMAERNRTGRFDSILLFHPLLPRLAWTKPKIGSFKLLLLLLLLLVIEPPTAQGTNEASNQFGSIEALPWSSLCLSFFLFLFLRIGLFPLDKLLIESASFVLPPPETEINFFHPVLLIISGFLDSRDLSFSFEMI